VPRKPRCSVDHVHLELVPRDRGICRERGAQILESLVDLLALLHRATTMAHEFDLFLEIGPRQRERNAPLLVETQGRGDSPGADGGL